jgi:hypothetical protein
MAGLGRVNGTGQGEIRVRRFEVGLFLLIALCASSAVAAGPASATGCHNEATRERQGSTFLPDCRAYEMVSPVDKGGSDVSGGFGATRAAVSGSAVVYDSTGNYAPAGGSGAAGMTTYLARRGTPSWSQEGLIPAQGVYVGAGFYGARFGGMSEDLTKGVFNSFSTPLTADAPPGDTEQLYLRNNEGGAYELLTRSVAPVPFDLTYVPMFNDATPDFSTITFTSNKNLTADANGTSRKLYKWNAAGLELAGILPDGTAAQESTSGIAGTDDGNARKRSLTTGRAWCLSPPTAVPSRSTCERAMTPPSKFPNPRRAHPKVSRGRRPSRRAIRRSPTCSSPPPRSWSTKIQIPLKNLAHQTSTSTTRTPRRGTT